MLELRSRLQQVCCERSVIRLPFLFVQVRDPEPGEPHRCRAPFACRNTPSQKRKRRGNASWKDVFLDYLLQVLNCQPTGQSASSPLAEHLITVCKSNAYDFVSSFYCCTPHNSSCVTNFDEVSLWSNCKFGLILTRLSSTILVFIQRWSLKYLWIYFSS